MSRPSIRDIEARMARLMADGQETPSAKDLAALVGDMVEELTSADAQTGDPQSTAAGGEAGAFEAEVALQALCDIGAVDQAGGPLSDVQQELDEIRAVTADAAAQYLSCAESVETLSESDGLGDQDKAALMDRATEMCEAAAFQDITGQRLTRIAQLLRQIEYGVASAKVSLGDAEAAEAVEALSEVVENTEQRKVEHILHGPQEAGTANTQEEIDKILASFN